MSGSARPVAVSSATRLSTTPDGRVARLASAAAAPTASAAGRARAAHLRTAATPTPPSPGAPSGSALVGYAQVDRRAGPSVELVVAPRPPPAAASAAPLAGALLEARRTVGCACGRTASSPARRRSPRRWASTASRELCADAPRARPARCRTPSLPRRVSGCDVPARARRRGVAALNARGLRRPPRAGRLDRRTTSRPGWPSRGSTRRASSSPGGRRDRDGGLPLDEGARARTPAHEHVGEVYVVGVDPAAAGPRPRTRHSPSRGCTTSQQRA